MAVVVGIGAAYKMYTDNRWAAWNGLCVAGRVSTRGLALVVALHTRMCVATVVDRRGWGGLGAGEVGGRRLACWRTCTLAGCSDTVR